ncbi:MAG: DUF4150 domain-containing protein [Gammaproteobacteria bacterium]|nr:DUF4150 domain-containing protein [Gammaproteobacteria bacterium]
MPVTIKVNGVFNSLVHKGSNGVSVATIPDVCKTPSPGGPVPIPYPNISQAAMLAKGTKTVKADGGMMIAVKGSEFSMSNGDEPGTIGGVKSSTFIKESTWILYSFDVKMDGKNACRLTDKMFHNHENTVNLAGVLQGPVVVIDVSKLGSTQEEACDKLAENEVKDHDKAAEDAGMLKEDYDALRDVAGDNNVLASFRDTNKDCLPHLKAGVPSKGHDVLEKTWSSANLPADKQGYAGLVSTRLSKPGAGEVIANPKRRLKNGGPLTGDYDMHDLISSGSGNRIRGGSAREQRLIDRMNDAIPGDQPRVMHGPQANYGDFVKQSGEKPVPKLFAPDPPVTAMDGKTKPAKVYRLESNEDIVNMYRCKGTNMPEEWNIQDGQGNAVSAKLK